MARKAPREDVPEVTEPKRWSAGIPAVNHAPRREYDRMRVRRTALTILRSGFGGASLAGPSTVRRAPRAEGEEGELFVVGEERHLPHDRPPPSKGFLMVALDADALAPLPRPRSSRETSTAVPSRPSTDARAPLSPCSP